MIIRVVYPLTDDYKDYFEVLDGEFSLGDIVVVDNEIHTMKHYGVVMKVNCNPKGRYNRRKIKVASQLDRVLFWSEFESKVLHNGIKLNTRALEQYRQTGTNNELTEEEMSAKMARNLLLIHHPYRITISKHGQLVFNYGALRLTYGNGTIHNIINHVNIPRGWKKDWHKHWYYSKILGVELS